MRNKKKKKSAPVCYVETEKIIPAYLIGAIAAAAVSLYFYKLFAFFDYLMWDLSLYQEIGDFFPTTSFIICFFSAMAAVILLCLFCLARKTVRLEVKRGKA